MDSLANAARTLTRTIVIVAFLALLAVSTAERAGANQQGDPVDVANKQKALCELLGGKVLPDDYQVNRYVDGIRSTSIKCTGGYLDGMDCWNSRTYGTFCSFPLVRPEEPPAVAPTGGVEAEPEPQVPTTEVTDEVVVPTEGVEEPIIEEPVVEEPVIEGGVDDEGVAEETVDDGAEDNAGQDLPTNPALDETTAPTEGEPVADAGEGTGGGAAVEEQIASDAGMEFYVLEADEQA